MPITVGQWLKQYREAADLQQWEVADRMGVSRPYISRIERDVAKRPSYSLLVRIAKSVGKDVALLLYETGLEEKYASELNKSLSDGQKVLIQRVTTHFEGLDGDRAERAWRILESAVGELRPGRRDRLQLLAPESKEPQAAHESQDDTHDAPPTEHQ